MTRSKILLIIFGFVIFHSPGACQESGATADTVIQVVKDSTMAKTLVQAIGIATGEEQSHRWLSISCGSLPAGSTLLQPIYETDGATGSFWLTLSGLDTSAYLGDRILHGNGHYPIHLKVDFGDSQTITVTGKTLPFADAMCYYSFDSAEYRLDLSFPESVLPEVSDPPGLVYPAQGIDLSSTSGMEQAFPSEAYKNSTQKSKTMLMDSIVIASIILGSIMLILGLTLIIFKMLQKRSGKAPNFADVLDHKAGNERQIPIINPETDPGKTLKLQETSIRELMQSDNISYDEAALRIQYQIMNQDSD